MSNCSACYVVIKRDTFSVINVSEMYHNNSQSEIPAVQCQTAAPGRRRYPQSQGRPASSSRGVGGFRFRRGTKLACLNFGSHLFFQPWKQQQSLFYDSYQVLLLPVTNAVPAGPATSRLWRPVAAV